MTDYAHPLTDDEKAVIDDAIMDDNDRKQGFVVTGPGGTDGNTPTIYEAVESIFAARHADLIRRLNAAEGELDSLTGICDQYGLPYSVAGLHRHLTNNAGAVYQAKDALVDDLRAEVDRLRSGMTDLIDGAYDLTVIGHEDAVRVRDLATLLDGPTGERGGDE